MSDRVVDLTAWRARSVYRRASALLTESRRLLVQYEAARRFYLPSRLNARAAHMRPVVAPMYSENRHGARGVTRG